MLPWLEIRPVPDDIKGTVRRRIEGEAWRAIVREHLGPDTVINYAHNGAPVLGKGLGHIGVSHTKGWVAVVWSPEPCAVDIELKSRKLSPSTAARMGIIAPLPCPQAASENDPLLSAWCAYEAVYKYNGAIAAKTAHETQIETAPTPLSAPEKVPQVKFHPHPELIVAVILQ